MASLCKEDASYCGAAIVNKTETRPSEVASLIPMFPVPPSEELALTKEFPPIQFTSVQDLKNKVATLQHELENGGKRQHLSFCQVFQDLFDRLEKNRTVDLGQGVRFMWFADIKTLIVKLPALPHEKAHLLFGQVLMCRTVLMGLGNIEFTPIGATLYKEKGSAKEADSSWINQALRPQKGQFPHFVIEAGLSESLSRLRADVRWWLEYSQRAVNIVLIVWVQPDRKKVRLEKWCPGQGPTTRSSSRLATSNAFPIIETTVTVDQSRTASLISGAPLRLEFNKVIGRPPIPPLEQDFILDHQDLDDLVTHLWIGT